MQSMLKAASSFSETIHNAHNILVVSHVDADGLTSAAVINRALERIGADFSTQFVKQLDENELNGIADANPDLVLFTDLGSGLVGDIAALGINAVISDHHQIQPGADPQAIEHHLNPHLFGYDGANELSGAGTTLILAMALDSANKDMADLAVVGAVGDLQSRKEGMLIGVNREVLELGVEAGVLSYEKDLRMFGRQTRPLHKLLQYSSDPYIPGISGNGSGCISFLQQTNINLKTDKWRRWIDLQQSEKQTIVSQLIQHALSNGVPSHLLERLIGEVYTLLREEEGSEVRDATEYATLLNATARYDHADVGLAVCLGDRDKEYTRAKTLLSEHRANLVDGLSFVRENGITELDNLQYFYSKDRIRETIVGIIAGMASSITNNRDKPIIGIADTEDNQVKISARGTQKLVRKGLNLGAAISEIAAEFEGIGGGHDIAAGGTIPQDCMEEFIAQLDRKIGEQIRG